MVTLRKGGFFYKAAASGSGGVLVKAEKGINDAALNSGRQKTISYGVLASHNKSADDKNLRLTFDSLASHDITYVGIIQSARASGLERFPVPYVLTNCHNSLCAVGGTINEDDHRFALSAAVKYGGIYVPPHLAVIHAYKREMFAGCGRMILGSDSHTRYGALGTLGVGEGGGELVKQLLSRTYDIAYPEVIAVELKGAPRNGVGPHDAALSIIKEVFENGFAKNKVLEFIGEGIKNLSQDFRNSLDVMTTETACWSSIWETDEKTKAWLGAAGRADAFCELHPQDGAYYDGALTVDLGKIEPCIALPFHPANVWTIREFNENACDILAGVEKEAARLFENKVFLDLRSKLRNNRTKVRKLFVDQAIIAGCSGGTPGNLAAAAKILAAQSSTENTASGFSLSVYPESQSTQSLLMKNGILAALQEAGAVTHTAFCGPCFGAGETPSNGALSIRHTTRNFPNREGSKPGEGQLAAVALMDARSIAATAACGRQLTSAFEVEGFEEPSEPFAPDVSVYKKRIYSGWGKPEKDAPLVFGPNIKDFPAIPAMQEHLILKIAAFIRDSVTTTDELIPSGETSSFRSNPLRLAEFTLSRRAPDYVQKARAVQEMSAGEKEPLYKKAAALEKNAVSTKNCLFQSAVYARKPGDGSAREQAASCQRVLGGGANFALEYATKRYRSNLLNWGILPFLIEDENDIAPDVFVFVPHIRAAIENENDKIRAYRLDTGAAFTLKLGALTQPERETLLSGCLINYYKKER